MELTIRPLTKRDVANFAEHFARHRGESGRGDPHFMPFEPGRDDGPRGLDAAALDRGLDRPGWQRWFVAVTDDGRIVGHVNLKGDTLRTGSHRCQLGIGIERSYRQQGLGTRLMTAAIEFAREARSIDWVDLTVFAHNAPARKLYERLGFREVGTIPDRFRIDSTSIDDVLMSLDVSA